MIEMHGLEEIIGFRILSAPYKPLRWSNFGPVTQAVKRHLAAQSAIGNGDHAFGIQRRKISSVAFANFSLLFIHHRSSGHRVASATKDNNNSARAASYGERPVWFARVPTSQSGGVLPSAISDPAC
jgi:hypothetical protein